MKKSKRSYVLPLEENERITLSIGLIAGFLTVIFSLDKFLPDQKSIWVQLITNMVYIGLAGSSICFFIYLIFRAASLRNIGDNSIPLLNVKITPEITYFFFHEGVEIALMVPGVIAFQLYLAYFPDIIARSIEINYNLALIFSIVIVFLMSLFLPNLIRRAFSKIGDWIGDKNRS